MFEEFKAYLSRLRAWNVKIVEEKEQSFIFELKNKWTRKWFAVWYEDDMSKENMSGRPMNCRYHLNFEQLICQRDRFMTMIEDKWYTDEDSVLKRMKELVNRRRYG